MASSTQVILESLQQNDYVTLAILTAIAYDYVLTFPREIDYIWNKPRSLIFALFLLVRYLGLCAFMILVLSGSSFMPGPTEEYFQGWVFGVISLWAIFLFICAADAVMILRVWAMYSRSKLVLGTLLIFYVGEVAASTIGCVFYSIPGNYSVTAFQILDLSFCALGPFNLTWNKVSAISQLINAGVMILLVINQFIHQSLQMYKVTKRWQLNQFINLLVVEGVLYFLLILAWNLVNALYAFGKLPTQGLQTIPIFLVEYVPLATLTPRFILDVRELYARNIQGRHSSGIDSGFGLSSFSSRSVSKSTIMFADAGLDESLTLGGEIVMEQQTA